MRARGSVAASAYFFTKQLDLFAREADQALTLGALRCRDNRGAGVHDSERGRSPARGGPGQKGVTRSMPTRRPRLVSCDHLQSVGSVFEGLRSTTTRGRLCIVGSHGRSRSMPPSRCSTHTLRSSRFTASSASGQGRAASLAARCSRNIPARPAATFEDWWRLWNVRDDDIAKLMDGVHKSGVLEETTLPR